MTIDKQHRFFKSSGLDGVSYYFMLSDGLFMRFGTGIVSGQFGFSIHNDANWRNRQYDEVPLDEIFPVVAQSIGHLSASMERDKLRLSAICELHHMLSAANGGKVRTPPISDGIRVFGYVPFIQPEEVDMFNIIEQ